VRVEEIPSYRRENQSDGRVAAQARGEGNTQGDSCERRVMGKKLTSLSLSRDQAIRAKATECGYDMGIKLSFLSVANVSKRGGPYEKLKSHSPDSGGVLNHRQQISRFTRGSRLLPTIREQ